MSEIEITVDIAADAAPIDVQLKNGGGEPVYIKGDPGERGADGAPGKDGADGQNGLSAYDLAVRQGFVGSLDDWLASLRGQDGADGQPGKDADFDPTALEQRLTNLEQRPAAAPQDTGWRDITAHTALPVGVTLAQASGKVYLRRVGNQVYMAFSNYGWSARGNTQTFFTPEICAYTAPPQLMIDGRRTMMRHAGVIGADNRALILFYCDWLSPTSFRMATDTTLVTHGIASWLTDTPFPAEPLGTPAVFA